MFMSIYRLPMCCGASILVSEDGVCIFHALSSLVLIALEVVV